jgi:hypothetical protein
MALNLRLEISEVRYPVPVAAALGPSGRAPTQVRREKAECRKEDENLRVDGQTR